MDSEPKTPSEDELVRTYIEHLGPITLGTEFARQQEARRGIAKVKADALREWSGLVRSELTASASHGIDLSENYLHGTDSMLRQAGEYADRIEGAINE